MTHTLNDVTFGSTISWYYSYAPVSDFEDYHFIGAITRYCKPNHFGNVFDDYNTNSLLQTGINTSSVVLGLLIEQQDPRSANLEFRYAVARSLSSILYKSVSNSENVLIIEDIDVFMVEGDTVVNSDAREGDDDFNLYRNTRLYIEVSLKNESQKTHLISHLDTNIFDNKTLGTIKEEIQTSLFESIKSILYGFRYEHKSIKLMILN